VYFPRGIFLHLRAAGINHEITHQYFRSDVTSNGVVNRVSSKTSHPVDHGDNVYFDIASHETLWIFEGFISKTCHVPNSTL
jgi:hypothetical protein